MSTESSPPENDPNLSGLGRALLGTNEGSKPSGPWVPPTAEELHAILPQYEIVKMLGRGGMGAVYMGRQTALDRPVAIKILSAQLEESDMGFTERFKNEARAMGKLNHPAIVSVYEFGQHESGLLYIVMEYVDGTDVAKMIAAKGRLHTEHAMAITAHVCDALAYAHERGIIHRDIKPANVMVDYDGSVKIADFGLAKVNAGGQTLGLTQSGMAMGTLHFMAPEALMLGTSVDHRADIYAVGVMLYQMLTGKLPQGVFSMPSLQVPGLDPRYDAIIAKAMMEDREARYQSARELRSDLDGILTKPVVKADPEAAKAQQPVLPTQARPQRPGGKPVMRQSEAPSAPQSAPRGSQSWLWASALGLLAVGAAAWWLIQPKSLTKLPGAAEETTSTTPITSAPVNPGNASKEVWTPFLDKAEDFPPNGPLELRDGWVVMREGAPTSTLVGGLDVLDGAIRGEFRGVNCTLRLRSHNKTSYKLDYKLGKLILMWQDYDSAQQKVTYSTLKEVTLPDPPDAEEPFIMELRAVGQVITGSLNGREFLRVEDSRGSAAGTQGISLGNARARMIEQLILNSQPGIAAESTDPAKTDAALRMILGKGGRATITVGKEQRIVTRLEELPKDGAEVVEVRLIASSKNAIILSGADMQILAGLSVLERLILSDVSFPEGDLSVLRTLPRLASLELRGGKGLTVESFSPLGGMRSLRRLSTINMPEVDETFLPVILSMSQLESLGLHDCKGVSTGFVESLATLPKLNRLTVSGFQFGNPIDLGKFRALETLELYEFRASALDAALKGLAAGNGIKHLLFHGGALTEAQAQELAKWPGLSSLMLQKTKLPASGLASLSRSSIRELDCGDLDSLFNDAALLSAAKMPSLKLVKLASKSPITDAGLAAFRKLRPDVQVTRSQLSEPQIEPDVVTAANASRSPPFPSGVVQAVFTNSLGMKFARIPGTQNLVCIHETRRGDYARFANAVTGLDHSWRNPSHQGMSLPSGDDYPVTMVSWEDAQKFTDWLSKTEKLSYRLPSSREWSILSGLEQLESPNQSNVPGSRIRGVFPWGTQWPPPAMVANLADADYHRTQSSQGFLDGYKDGFESTAPVMSFKPSATGLYDLAGNVAELCRDLDDRWRKNAVVRGSSFDDWLDSVLTSAQRANLGTKTRLPNLGFRVVIENYSPVQTPVAPPDDALPTWTDTLGRSIQAKFVAIRGSDVLLDVAGKVTPVAMATLSPASQQQARELQPTNSAPPPSTAPTAPAASAASTAPTSTHATSFLVHSDDFDDGALSSAWRQDGKAWHCLTGELTTSKQFLQDGADKGGGIWLMRDLPKNFRVQFKLTQAERDEAELICEVAGRPAEAAARAIPGYRFHFQGVAKHVPVIRKGSLPLPGKAEPQREGYRLSEHVVIERRDGKTLEYRNGDVFKAEGMDASPIETGWLGFHFVKGAPLIDELRIYDLDQGTAPPVARLESQLPSGHLLTGQVRDHRNKPVGGGIVRLINKDVWHTKTDEIGRFVFKHLDEGTYTLSAESAAGLGSLPVQLRPGDRRTDVPITLKSIKTYGIRWVQQTKPGSLSLQGEGTVSGEAWVSAMHDGFVMSRGGPPDRLSGALECDFSLVLNGRRVTFGGRHGNGPVARLERVPFDAILAADQGGPLDKQGYFTNPLKSGDNLRQGDAFTVRNETDGTYGKVEIMHVPN